MGDEEQIAFPDPGVRRRHQAFDEAVAARPHFRIGRHPDHPFGVGAQRHRHQEGEEQQGRQPTKGDQQRALTLALHLGAGEYVVQCLEYGHQEHREHSPDGQHHADEEELPGDEEADGDRHEAAIDEGGRAVEQEPASLARCGLGPLQLAGTEQVTLGEPLPVQVGALRQIGNLDQVGEDVVGVVAQQRIAVEDQRGQAGHDDHVVGHRAHQPRFHRHPKVEGQGCQEELHHHPGGANEGPLPLAAEGSRGGRVDIGHGRQHEQHDTHLVHLAVAGLHRIGVTQFVEQLDRRKDQEQHQQVVGGEHLVAQAAGEFGPVHAGQHHRRQHRSEPQRHAQRTEQPGQGRPGALEEGRRIP